MTVTAVGAVTRRRCGSVARALAGAVCLAGGIAGPRGFAGAGGPNRAARDAATTRPSIAGGTAVFASDDNVYLYENLDRRVPIAPTLDAASNLQAQDRMRTLASPPSLIVPGHDPKVFARFPTVVPGVVRIEVR